MATHLLMQSGSNTALNLAVQISPMPGKPRSETQGEEGSQNYHTTENVNGQFLLLCGYKKP